jgi:large subunit ribosomal protein L29
MKNRDLRELTLEELDLKGKELKKEIFNIKFQLHTGRLENTAKVLALKKDIARVNTIVREKRG